MKILLVNKFHYLKGGSEKYYFELGNLLKENGHEVAYFSMKDERNITTGDKEYFVQPIDLNNGSKLQALDVIYSKQNYKKMIEAIEDFKPDIIHLNNFQRQLSASIVKAARDNKIPIVFTAHDVQAICPAITMLDSNHNICEDCIKGKYKNCFKKKCIKESSLKSLLGSIEGIYYRNHKIYTEKIDKIITPTEFYKNKLIEDGIRKEKLVAIHNFINFEDYEINTVDEGYALYIGRLSKEKGIFNLIEAFNNLKNKELRIAGDGPEKDKIVSLIEQKGLRDRVKLLGFLNKDQIQHEISKCSFVVIPSIWYENCPYSALETLSIGKPIIGANIGGIPELVIDNKTGLLYQYDSVEELKEKMELLWNDNKILNLMCKEAKKFAKENFSKALYYKEIIKVYNGIK